VITFDLQAKVCFGHDVLITLLRLFYCVALKKHLPSGTPERRFMKGALPLTFEKGAIRAQAPLYNSVIGNFRDAGKR